MKIPSFQESIEASTNPPTHPPDPPPTHPHPDPPPPTPTLPHPHLHPDKPPPTPTTPTTPHPQRYTNLTPGPEKSLSQKATGSMSRGSLQIASCYHNSMQQHNKQAGSIPFATYEFDSAESIPGAQDSRAQCHEPLKLNPLSRVCCQVLESLMHKTVARSLHHFQLCVGSIQHASFIQCWRLRIHKRKQAPCLSFLSSCMHVIPRPSKHRRCETLHGRSPQLHAGPMLDPILRQPHEAGGVLEASSPQRDPLKEGRGRVDPNASELGPSGFSFFSITCPVEI